MKIKSLNWIIFCFIAVACAVIATLLALRQQTSQSVIKEHAFAMPNTAEQKLPKYNLGRLMQSAVEPYDAHAIISIAPQHFVRDYMLDLARHLNHDFADKHILTVDILDDDAVAPTYMPVANEYTIFNEARRGTYFIPNV